MRSKFKAALFLVLVLACASFVAAQQANSVQLVIEGKVVRVSDGDTITVLDADNKQHRIRFQGIDAPESKQAYGQAAKENLSKMVFGKQVTVVWDKVDKYRRTVGKVLLDGRDINIEQVRAGFAWHYKKYADEQPAEDRVTYAKAEEEARAARRGLWQDPNPTPPGEWRADAKEERWGPPPPEGTIIGNKSSKKYHRPDCPGYRDMAERNRVFFKTVAEAEAAGYKRAGNCPAEVSVALVKAAGPVEYHAQENPREGKITPTDKPAENKTDAAASGEVVGNKNSKIYHNPGCPGYKSVSEKNRVFFKTAGEAEAAGYTRAKNCKAGDSGAGEASEATPSKAPSSDTAEKNQKKTPEETAPAAEASADAAETTAAAGEIIGNKNSKIYHRPDCPGYKSVSEKNQVKFKTVAEAEAAGFRAAKNCPSQPTQ
ncbi:MAG TPA: thermonuclease family protein [Pyrinomonadaceae bacterium]|nr:thermonuclease family protein [Pyrinomonadaceae bacterium]